MKNLPKIIKGVKGHEDLTIDFANTHLDLFLKFDEVEPFRKMLVSVFNAGKNGIVDEEIEADFSEWYSYCVNKVARPKALKQYIKARTRRSKEELLDGLMKQRPGMLKTRDENKAKGEKNLGKHILHPATWLTDDHCDDEVESYTPTTVKEVKVVHILTVEEIMTSKQGQYALEHGVGAFLLDYSQSNKQLPDRAGYKVLSVKWTEYMKKPSNERVYKNMLIREENLGKEYLKGK